MTTLNHIRRVGNQVQRINNRDHRRRLYNNPTREDVRNFNYRVASTGMDIGGGPYPTRTSTAFAGPGFEIPANAQVVNGHFVRQAAQARPQARPQAARAAPGRQPMQRRQRSNGNRQSHGDYNQVRRSGRDVHASGSVYYGGFDSPATSGTYREFLLFREQELARRREALEQREEVYHRQEEAYRLQEEACRRQEEACRLQEEAYSRERAAARARALEARRQQELIDSANAANAWVDANTQVTPDLADSTTPDASSGESSDTDAYEVATGAASQVSVADQTPRYVPEEVETNLDEAGDDSGSDYENHNHEDEDSDSGSMQRFYMHQSDYTGSLVVSN